MLLLKGLVLGFSIAAPVGPIGLLCINKTLKNGKLSGFLSGMGAASADMIYGAIAALGLTAISGLLLKYAFYIKLLGGLFLCYLGAKIFLAQKTEKAEEENSKGLLSDYLSTFFLTITNPMTIISFTAIFAGMGIMSTDKADIWEFIIGVFSGSLLWWLCLAFIAGYVGKKSDQKFISIVNKVSGIIIFLFGIWAMLSK